MDHTLTQSTHTHHTHSLKSLTATERRFPLRLVCEFITRRRVARGGPAVNLRMGGVPARVAGGFSPGSFSAKRHDERPDSATSTPTPGSRCGSPGTAGRRSPDAAVLPGALAAHHLDLPDATAPAGLAAGRRRAATGRAGAAERPAARARAAPAPRRSRRCSRAARRWPVLPSCVVRRVRRRGDREAGGGDPELDELRRAPRRTGRALEGRMTLAALEARFRFDAGASAYLRTLRARRFGFAANGRRSGSGETCAVLWRTVSA